MARYKVNITYDGTAFCGIQRQRDNRTVQTEIESALQQIGWQGDSILYAGRTDSGVHASGQVIAFDLDWRHGSLELLQALNANMPADIAAWKVEEASADFHPRYHALARRYSYQIFCQPLRNPLRERFAWRVWPGLDLDKLQQAALLLEGEHDFAAYGTPFKRGGPTVRRVDQAEWQQLEDAYTFCITANAFLYHMVRRLVNIQVEIGQGRHLPSIISEYLDDSPAEMVQGLAPPHGLQLSKVYYE